MVRTKVNRFTLSSDTAKVSGNRSETQAAMEARRNIKTALENERLTTASTGLTHQTRPLQIKTQTALNQNKIEREPIVTFRKKLYRKEPESGQLKQQHQDQHQIHFIHQGSVSENTKKQSIFEDTIKKAASDISIEYPPKGLYKKNRNKGNVSHRSKQKYYIIDEHGDSTQVNQAKAFSNESLECMEIMKAAIRDVVHEKISQITGSRFQTINERLDEMLSMIKKNETAIEECSKELRAKLKYYGEDTSRHLKYLCMKLEYEKLMSQNINTFLASDLSRQVNNNTVSNCQNKNDYCTHRSQNYCRRCTAPACCCCSHKPQQRIHRKCNSDDCVAANSSRQKTNNEKTTRNVKNAQSNTSATTDSLERTSTLMQEEIDKMEAQNVNETTNITIPQILNNFLRYKLQSNGKYQMPANTAVNNCNEENIPGTSTNSNGNSTQNNGTGSADIRLRDILDSIEKYYPALDTETAEEDIKLENSKSEINVKVNDDDEDDGPTSEDTVDEDEESEECKISVNESDNNFCDNIDDCKCVSDEAS